MKKSNWHINLYRCIEYYISELNDKHLKIDDLMVDLLKVIDDLSQDFFNFKGSSWIMGARVHVKIKHVRSFFSCKLGHLYIISTFSILSGCQANELLRESTDF